MDSDLTRIRYLPGADPGAETQGWEGSGGTAGKRGKGGRDRGAIVFGGGGLAVRGEHQTQSPAS